MDFSSARSNGTWTEDTQITQSRQPLYLACAGIAAVVLIASAYLIGFLGGNSNVTKLATHNSALQHQVNGLTRQLDSLHVSQTRCSVYKQDETTMRRLMDRGKFGEAAAVAELDLGGKSQPVCVGSALLSTWYQAKMQNLFDTASGLPIGDSSVATWNGIRREADTLGIAQDPALATFSTAYRNQLWPLAIAAFQAALSEGQVAVADNDQVGMYYSTLRNCGHVLAFHYGGSSRTRGLRYLSTARAISAKAGLKRGEADADLAFLLGPNPRRWPHPDESDPVLQALTSR